MIGRHRKKKFEPAPVLSVVLAGVFAGAVAVAPLDGGPADGGSADSKEPPSTKAVAERVDRSATKRDAAPPREAPDDCDPSESVDEYPNGRIPVDQLCKLPQDGEYLRADAAVAFYKLNVAYHERFGKQMCVRSSYRGYNKQKELYQRMPAGMAARPGNSKHGIGIAVDLCDGVQRASSPQFKWLEDNSEKYGWIHPKWAYSSPYEPWHWEFDVGQE
ncbi:hypothetical protein E1200_06950 [Actinomadura sp. GC306]|uniref:M15 family metallopeptidase n=1 Tax=Actinomadura sp. GC306 TaxID=2530367 RepID=UPI00104D2574|nr:M15 family metallopeptidase [Actinomadura sp. GC306]TDC69923.1 hypothetical protein E1200_06950 [Actinomadura sp. GC306]